MLEKKKRSRVPSQDQSSTSSKSGVFTNLLKRSGSTKSLIKTEEPKINEEIKRINSIELTPIETAAYQILRLDTRQAITFSLEVINKAYQKLAVSVHPADNLSEKIAAEEAFKKLTKAKAIAERKTSNEDMPSAIASSDFDIIFNKDLKKEPKVVEIQHIIMTWGGFDKEKWPRSTDVIQYFEGLDLGSEEIEKTDKGNLMEYVQEFFPRQNKSVEDIAKENSPEDLVRYKLFLFGLMNRYPQLHKRYAETFMEEVLNLLGKVEKSLTSLTEKFALPAKPQELIKLDGFMDFACQFYSGIKSEGGLVLDQKSHKAAFAVLDNCVQRNLEFFSKLIHKAELLRNQLNPHAIFTYSDTALEKEENKDKAKSIDVLCYVQSQIEVLNAQLTYIIRLILGNYFIAKLPNELEKRFPKEESIETVNSKADPINPVIPGDLLGESEENISFLAIYEKYYNECDVISLRVGLKKSIANKMVEKENKLFILSTIEKTWSNLPPTKSLPLKKSFSGTSLPKKTLPEENLEAPLLTGQIATLSRQNKLLADELKKEKETFQQYTKDLEKIKSENSKLAEEQRKLVEEQYQEANLKQQQETVLLDLQGRRQTLEEKLKSENTVVGNIESELNLTLIEKQQKEQELLYKKNEIQNLRNEIKKLSTDSDRLVNELKQKEALKEEINKQLGEKEQEKQRLETLLFDTEEKIKEYGLLETEQKTRAQATEENLLQMVGDQNFFLRLQRDPDYQTLVSRINEIRQRPINNPSFQHGERNNDKADALLWLKRAVEGHPVPFDEEGKPAPSTLLPDANKKEKRATFKEVYDYLDSEKYLYSTIITQPTRIQTGFFSFFTGEVTSAKLFPAVKAKFEEEKIVREQQRQLSQPSVVIM